MNAIELAQGAIRLLQTGKRDALWYFKDSTGAALIEVIVAMSFRADEHWSKMYKLTPEREMELYVEALYKLQQNAL